MRTINFYISIVLLMILATACKENDMFLYQDDPAVYFANERYGQQDSIVYSFFVKGKEITIDTVKVKVCMSGLPADYDRPIVLLQANVGGEDAAVSGVHFLPFDDPLVAESIFMPKGSVVAYIPIIMLRDKSLLTEGKRLELSFAQNDFFRPGIDEWGKLTITISDFAVKPTKWDTYWRRFFGSTFGSVKFKFIIEHTGITDFDNTDLEEGYASWLSATVKQKLFEYNEANPDEPLCEANGEEVTFT